MPNRASSPGDEIRARLPADSELRAINKHIKARTPGIGSGHLSRNRYAQQRKLRGQSQGRNRGGTLAGWAVVRARDLDPSNLMPWELETQAPLFGNQIGLQRFVSCARPRSAPLYIVPRRGRTLEMYEEGLVAAPEVTG